MKIAAVSFLFVVAFLVSTSAISSSPKGKGDSSGGKLRRSRTVSKNKGGEFVRGRHLD